MKSLNRGLNIFSRPVIRINLIAEIIVQRQHAGMAASLQSAQPWSRSFQQNKSALLPSPLDRWSREKGGDGLKPFYKWKLWTNNESWEAKSRSLSNRRVMLHSWHAQNQIVQAFNFKLQNINKCFSYILGSVFNVQNLVPLKKMRCPCLPVPGSNNSELGRMNAI